MTPTRKQVQAVIAELRNARGHIRETYTQAQAAAMLEVWPWPDDTRKEVQDADIPAHSVTGDAHPPNANQPDATPDRDARIPPARAGSQEAAGPASDQQEDAGPFDLETPKVYSRIEREAASDGLRYAGHDLLSELRKGRAEIQRLKHELSQLCALDTYVEISRQQAEIAEARAEIERLKAEIERLKNGG